LAKRQTKKQPEKPTPEWKNLELVIAGIQKELEPDAEVKHDDWIKGKSGEWRKLDVSIRKKIGTAIALIAIDCKRHNKPVGRGDVAKFVEQVEDVGAQAGIMISDSGYGRGSKYLARLKNILLQTYNEVVDIDWKSLIGEGWLTLTKPRLEDTEAFVILGTHETVYKVPGLNLALYDENGNEECGLHDLFWQAWEQEPRIRPIGYRELKLDCPDPPFYIKMDENLYIARGFIVKGKMVMKKYLLNLQIATGKIIKDINTNRVGYLQATTQSFNFGHILKSQEGIEITSEEWEEIERKSLGSVRLNEDYYYRLVLSGDSDKPADAK
jgi:Restriction endonuclease